MTENEIKFASNYIATIALEDNGAEKVNIAIQSLLSTYLKEASLNVPKNNDFKPLSTIITFTQKEISHMALAPSLAARNAAPHPAAPPPTTITS